MNALQWFESLPDIIPEKKIKPPQQIRTVKDKLLKRDGDLCKLCGKKIAGNNISIDHIRPKSKGGSNDLWNLQLAHPKCNQAKGNEFIIWSP